MKALVLAALALVILPATSHAKRSNLIYSNAEIVKVEDNHMFPVRTVTLTAMLPCGAREIGGFVNQLGEGRVEVGVRVAMPAGGMFCLAMPSPVEVPVSFHAELPVDVSVLNLNLNHPDFQN